MIRLIRRLTEEDGIKAIQHSLMAAGAIVAVIGVAIIGVAIVAAVLAVYGQIYNVFNEILSTLQFVTIK